MIKILNSKRVNLLKLKRSQLKIVSRLSATLHTTLLQKDVLRTSCTQAHADCNLLKIHLLL